MMSLLRECELNPQEKQSAGIQTQDFLNNSQTLLPLSHLDPWQRNGTHASCMNSQIPTDSHSLKAALNGNPD